MSWGLIPEVLLYGAFWLWLLGLIPAAVVCLLKGRLLLFAAGFLTFGITWFLGAMPLADTDSAWAQRFYGEKRLARAADPIHHPRPIRIAALWVCGTAALVFAVGLLAARPTPVTGVDGKALQYSVSGGNLGFSVEPCGHGDGGSWSCSVYDDGFSGAVPYDVRVGGLGCWTAIRAGRAGEGASKRLSGCLTVWDQIRLFDRLL